MPHILATQRAALEQDPACAGAARRKSPSSFKHRFVHALSTFVFPASHPSTLEQATYQLLFVYSTISKQTSRAATPTFPANISYEASFCYFSILYSVHTNTLPATFATCLLRSHYLSHPARIFYLALSYNTSHMFLYILISIVFSTSFLICSIFQRG